MTIRLLMLCACLLLPVSQSQAALGVLACEPEWGSLLEELGGDKVDVYNATNAFQDPHHIQAKPSLLARARRAELLVCTGAQLEVGWLPVLLRQSGNRAIQPGEPGNFEAAAVVSMLDVPASIDRSQGDVHPSGNPHIHTDPRNIARVAEALSGRLAQLDPGNAETYRSRYQDFSRRWGAAITRWEQQAARLRGTVVVVEHRGFPYLENWLGLKEVAALEPKPGVEPTAAHLQEVLEILGRQPAKMVIRAAYNDDRGSSWLAGHAGIPAVELPFTVGGSDAAGDLFGLFDDTVQRLLGALQ